MKSLDYKTPTIYYGDHSFTCRGLGLFLYAINNLSVILKDLLGDRARTLLGKFTRIYFGILFFGLFTVETAVERLKK